MQSINIFLSLFDGDGEWPISFGVETKLCRLTAWSVECERKTRFWILIAIAGFFLIGLMHTRLTFFSSVYFFSGFLYNWLAHKRRITRINLRISRPYTEFWFIDERKLMRKMNLNVDTFIHMIEQKHARMKRKMCLLNWVSIWMMVINFFFQILSKPIQKILNSLIFSTYF